MKWPAHGSNPQYLYQSANLPVPDKYLDFSANINPLGPPQALKMKWPDFYDEISEYPDPLSLNFKKMIAGKEELSMDSILIGNGGAELITLIGRMLAGKNVLIVEPAFSEYEKACRANDCSIFYFHLHAPNWELNVKELDTFLDKVDAVFLCNPNNPSGVRFSFSTVFQILEQCKQTETLLIVDEAFYDFLEDYEPISLLIRDYSNLIILRSMTKMFAIPGLRLGYTLAAPDTIEKLSVYQSHWSVNAIAMLAGEVCLKEKSYVHETIRYISKEREKLFSFFVKEDFLFSPSHVNFYLLQDPRQKEQFSFFTFLLQKGIVPRHTFNFPGLDGNWLRFAIKGEKDNERLMEVLSEWRQLH